MKSAQVKMVIDLSYPAEGLYPKALAAVRMTAVLFCPHLTAQLCGLPAFMKLGEKGISHQNKDLHIRAG